LVFRARPVTELRTRDLSSRQTLQSAAVNTARLLGTQGAQAARGLAHRSHTQRAVLRHRDGLPGRGERGVCQVKLGICSPGRIGGHPTAGD
jgi:hypothetical protein